MLLRFSLHFCLEKVCRKYGKKREDTHCETKQMYIYIQAFSRCFHLQQLSKSINRIIGQTANNINLINVQFIMMNELVCLSVLLRGL